MNPVVQQPVDFGILPGSLRPCPGEESAGGGHSFHWQVEAGNWAVFLEAVLVPCSILVRAGKWDVVCGSKRRAVWNLPASPQGPGRLPLRTISLQVPCPPVGLSPPAPRALTSILLWLRLSGHTADELWTWVLTPGSRLTVVLRLVTFSGARVSSPAKWG